MTPDWIAEAIDPRSRNHKGGRAPDRRGPAGVKSYVLGTSVTREELDDKARLVGRAIELVVVEPSGATSVLLRVVNQAWSELTGPAFDPSGTRLYLSSQRGPTGTGSGVTYEVTGPFRTSPLPTTTTAPATTTTIKRKGPKPR